MPTFLSARRDLLLELVRSRLVLDVPASGYCRLCSAINEVDGAIEVARPANRLGFAEGDTLECAAG